MSTCLNQGWVREDEVRAGCPLLWLNFEAVGSVPGVKSYVEERGGQLEYFVDRIKLF